MDEGGTPAPDNGVASMQNAQRTAQAPRQPAEKVWKPTGSPVGGCHIVVSLLATVLFTAGEYAGLGIGGMERLIVYPVLIWGAMFGDSLSSSSQAS